MSKKLTFETFNWEEDLDFHERECAKELRKEILEIWKERGVEGKEGCDQCEELIVRLNDQAGISSRYERMWSEAIAKCFKE
ncbi:hypothetical protein ANCCAN_25813 [Ancylostoma caninum]|uniref:Uncharacterized protein n=1 Tax=Ancylostoma caninum TaxID=29170 RepID=A0A368F8F1_ANCCA|nr:hypothetical protein ANCCAN_25813 [Ancylostoma caninum]